MVTMRIFPFKEKSPWQFRESNPAPHNQLSETLTNRPRGWSSAVIINGLIKDLEYPHDPEE
jgi:hypothetical protein